jgi:hypothetical protein
MRTLILLAVFYTWTTAAAPWDSVRRLAGGSSIELSTKDGQNRTVEVVSSTADSLIVRTRSGEESVARSEVRSIRKKVPGRRARLGLIGVAIGAGAGAGLGFLVCPSCENETGTSLAGGGAAIGAGVGALGFLSSDYKVVYLAPK